MKRSVTTNSGVSLIRIFHSNHFQTAILALFIISAAFFLLVQYEKEAEALLKKWEPYYDYRAHPKILRAKPIIKNQPVNLNRYSIKANFMITADIRGDNVEIQFCDKYILSWTNMLAGVYRKLDNSLRKEYVSRINYRDVIFSKKAAYSRLEKLNFCLKCDLIEKTAGIYINDKLIEKIYLGPETISYAVNLNKKSRQKIILNKLEISDNNGKILFSADYAALFFYKLISQILLFFGSAIFLLLACSKKHFFKRWVYFIIVLLSIEGFLRIEEKHNQNFNINLLKNPNINLYEVYNNSQEIAIHNIYHWDFGPKVYKIAKPENAKRIICIGTSPIAGTRVPEPLEQVFPALLEKKMNQGDNSRNEVINVTLREAYINSPATNIYIRDGLLKLSPDMILFYMNWEPPPEDYSKEYILENYIMPDRIKKAMEKNSSWIKNYRLLFAALEFKNPIKEIIFLYDFLCNSYLFMGMESARKIVFNKLCYSQRLSIEKPTSYFDETLKLCREKKIKMLLIPLFDFGYFANSPLTTKEIAKIIKENPDVYYLDLKEVFSKNRDHLLAYDNSHPTEYGYKIIAEEIFRKLKKEKLIDINEGP